MGTLISPSQIYPDPSSRKFSTRKMLVLGGVFLTIVITCLGVWFFLFSSKTSQNIIQKASSSIVYKNFEYSFSIKYPDNYYVSDNLNSLSNDKYLAFIPNQKSFMESSVFIFIKEVPKNNYPDLEDYFVYLEKFGVRDLIIQTQHYATSSIIERGNGVIVVHDENGKEIEKYEKGKDFDFQRKTIGGMPSLMFTRYFYGIAGEPNVDTYINLGIFGANTQLKVLKISGIGSDVMNGIISSFEII